MKTGGARGVFFALPLILLLASCTPGKPKSDPPQTLYLRSVAKIKTLDPIHADDTYSNEEIGKTYESLLQYHYLKRPYVLIPNLAESMPEVSADKKTYTFKLKKGILFQDDPCFRETQGKGREMTAEDVVYSYKRLADPKLHAAGWWIFDEKIQGLNKWRDEASQTGTTDYSKPVEGLRAVDRYTIQIQLTRPLTPFLYFIAMKSASIVPREAVEYYGKEFMNHPVGTGPFKLVEFNSSSKVVWVKNPTFRQETYPSEGSPGDREAGLLADAGKPLPLVDKIYVYIMEEQQPMWLNFMAGKLDLVDIPKDNFGQAITASKELSPELKSKGIELVKFERMDITHITFNMEDPLIGKNKLLRQALSLAFDQEAFNEIFYNRGHAVSAQGPIPPGVVGYDAKFKNPYRQYNVAKAKEYLARAGYPDGKGLPPIEWATRGVTVDRQLTEYVQKMWGAIKVKLNVSSYSWPEFLSVIKNKKAQAFSYAWTGDYPDAENFFQLFYSKNKSPGPNDSNYSNPEFDRLYERALGMPDGLERTKLYHKMRDILVEDSPWVWSAHRIGYYVKQAWLKNYKYNDVEHSKFKYFRVDPAFKKSP